MSWFVWQNSVSTKYEYSFSQMKVSMDEFRSLAARYADLHQASFDADYATLRNVELYPDICQPDLAAVICLQCQLFLLNCLPSQQQSCLLVSHVIEALILDSQTPRYDFSIISLSIWPDIYIELWQGKPALKGNFSLIQLSGVRPPGVCADPQRIWETHDVSLQPCAGGSGGPRQEAPSCFFSGEIKM